MKIDNIDDLTYILVMWPESQVIMDYEWFNDEASLAHDKFSHSAYFIPKVRYDEYLNDIRNKEKNKHTGASVTYNNKLCKIHDFNDRMKYKNSVHKPTEKEMLVIKALPLSPINMFPDADNPELHEWYEIGDDKYGRSMYCHKTKYRRATTMPEFYQSATVD